MIVDIQAWLIRNQQTSQATYLRARHVYRGYILMHRGVLYVQ